MSDNQHRVILVPTDFSETCQNAIDHAVELSGYLKFKVSVLHVINQETRSQLKKDKLDKQAIQDKLEAIVQDIKSKSEIDVDHLSREGSIFKEINEAAAEIGANIMVLGTHGKKGLQHLLGSFAFKVVSKSPVPTIVVQKRGFKEGYENIVFPIDDFTEPRQQVNWALHIAKSFNSTLHIYQQNTKDLDVIKKFNVVKGQIEEAFQQNKVNYKFETAEKQSNYAEQLIKYAATINSDLILMMTSADIFSPDFPAAKWSEKLMFNGAQIPVMCINPVETGNVHYQYISLI